jgi:hypothetical protein
MEKTKTELLKEVNDELSNLCFHAGRQMYSIKLKEEELEDMRRTMANMEVDWRKTHHEFKKALEAQQKEIKTDPVALDPVN